MENKLIMILKEKLNDLDRSGIVPAEIKRNALKEELQYHVLNFICHHVDYSNWIMYGGTALKICHGLNRMSVDLDFEIKNPCTDKFLENLKKELEVYFNDTYAIGSEILTMKITSGRGLTLKFSVGNELGLGLASNMVHLKIDLNHFSIPKVVLERIPINHDQLSFVITTYNMASLFASKIAAIFLRGSRGVNEVRYEEKGRDIYDLLWYMGKKAVPDLDYLAAKRVDTQNLRTLFDRLTLKMNDVSDANLKQDLSPLFVDQTYIQHWLESWRENYKRLLESYEINTIEKLRGVLCTTTNTDSYHFVFEYESEERKIVRIGFSVTDEFVRTHKALGVKINNDITRLLKFENAGRMSEYLNDYATIFSLKIDGYLKKTRGVILGNNIKTKTIRIDAFNLDRREQVVLNLSVLLSCELEDLMK